MVVDFDRDALLRWFRHRGRDLPWRRTRDPWPVLVSELMLQQTQVSRVVPKFETFVDRFPTIVSCAAAPLAEIVALWQGLGYNRRAVNLHRCAGVVVDRFDGELPDRLDELLSLPGIGPYTARAILAFAHEIDVGVLDTNVATVLARQSNRTLDRTSAQALADELVPTGAGWMWNQAMLDLGATVCRKRSPACELCPVAGSCDWLEHDCPPPDPATGSAGVSTPQSRFEGSDRQGRGRLVDALRVAPVRWVDVAGAAGWPGDRRRAERVARTVMSDGLAERDGEWLRLPE